MPQRKETAHLDSKKLEAALKKGDAEALSNVLEQGYKDRVSSSNCTFQKDLAREIMNLIGYEAPAEVRATTNKAVAELEALKQILESEGVKDKKVFASIEQRIDNASQQVIVSDGVTKAFQSLLIESLAFRMRNDDSFNKEAVKAADAIDGIIADIIEYGPKRSMTKAEKEEYDRKKAAGEDVNGEEEDEYEE